MKEQKRAISIQDLTDALIKKWYWVSMPLIFFILFGIWLFVVLPRTYESTTLIVVQPQEIPQNYVESTVGAGVEERIRTLSQEVLARSNLETVIREMNLYLKERSKGVPMDILVESLRKKIRVDTSMQGRGGTSSFTITYRGGDPKKVADVTNRLASFFIDTNLKLRARQATETTAFLQKQLEELKTLLNQQEAKVQEYRNQYIGKLPDQLQSNISTIGSLQSRLESLQTSLTGAMNRKLTIQSQLSQTEAGIPGTSSQRGQHLSDLKNQLDEMKTKYTPDYPGIKRLENQIAEIEKNPEKTSSNRTDPQVVDLRNQLNNTNFEVASLRKDSERLKAQIEQYQGRVEETPKREQDLAGLTRDYNITQQNYQRLLDKFYEAKRAEDLEKRQQGEQFRVVDYAEPPQTPASPNLMIIAVIFIGLGLGTGAGIIVLLEMLDTTVKGVKQLEGWSGTIPCITAIPLAQTESDKHKEWFMTIVFLGINGAIFLVGTTIIIISKFSNLVLALPVPLPF